MNQTKCPSSPGTASEASHGCYVYRPPTSRAWALPWSQCLCLSKFTCETIIPSDGLRRWGPLGGERSRGWSPLVPTPEQRQSSLSALPRADSGVDVCEPGRGPQGNGASCTLTSDSQPLEPWELKACCSNLCLHFVVVAEDRPDDSSCSKACLGLAGLLLSLHGGLHGHGGDLACLVSTVGQEWTQTLGHVQPPQAPPC